jgi:hypothetical protein
MPGVPGPLEQLNQLPRDRAPYVWADYAEILCLVSEDRLFTRDDLLDTMRDMRDLHVDVLPPEETEDITRAEANDRERRRLDDYFSHLTLRQGLFGEAYPFVLDEAGNVIRVRDPLAHAQELYVFLLLCSNLRHLSDHIQVLTRCFEVLSREVLEALLPAGAGAHLFGAKHGGHYVGSFWDKLNTLAADLKEKVVVPREKLRGRNGDGGLDLVGWIPMGDDGDEASGFPVIFGQCACSKEEWPAKQADIDFHKWRKRITFEVQPYNLLFVPFFLRRAHDEWERALEIGNTVLVDRLRILFFLRQNAAVIRQMESFPIVEAALAQRVPAA